MDTIDERSCGRESLFRLEMFAVDLFALIFFQQSVKTFQYHGLFVLLLIQSDLHDCSRCPVVVEGMVRHWL